MATGVLVAAAMALPILGRYVIAFAIGLFVAFVLIAVTNLPRYIAWVRRSRCITIEQLDALKVQFNDATAGLTAQDLSRALGLSDASELDRFESGRVAMPFELILRAASVLGRKDPVTFIMRATRAYNPDLWRALEALGVGKLVVQGAREREFANLYRARDAARALDDTQFAAVLAFAGAAFDLALDLVARTHKPAKPAKSVTSKVAPP